MSRNNKIAIILPYFGKLPELANYFFRSCSQNPEVSFMLFTDQKVNSEIPANISIIKLSLKEFKKLAEVKLQIRLTLKYPYKLCDYKPMYGHIFEDYLDEFQYWGYTDLDMILGAIRNFISDKDFEQYDIITSRKDSFAGNFTLFKNTKSNKYLYQNGDNWKIILANSLFVHSFPERFKERGRPVMSGFWFYFLSIITSPNIRLAHLCDLNEIVKSRPEIKVLYGDFILSDEVFKNLKIKNWKVVLDRGRFVESISNKTGLYFHFYRVKHQSNFKIEKLKAQDKLQGLVITEQGICIGD